MARQGHFAALCNLPVSCVSSFSAGLTNITSTTVLQKKLYRVGGFGFTFEPYILQGSALFYSTRLSDVHECTSAPMDSQLPGGVSNSAVFDCQLDKEDSGVQRFLDVGRQSLDQEFTSV